MSFFRTLLHTMLQLRAVSREAQDATIAERASKTKKRTNGSLASGDWNNPPLLEIASKQRLRDASIVSGIR
jgi:hypothetical protein